MASVGSRASGVWPSKRCGSSPPAAGSSTPPSSTRTGKKTDDVAFVDLGADFSFPLWFNVKGERAAAGFFVIPRYYINPADIVGQDGFDLGVDSHIEIGVSFQIHDQPEAVVHQDPQVVRCRGALCREPPVAADLPRFSILRRSVRDRRLKHRSCRGPIYSNGSFRPEEQVFLRENLETVRCRCAALGRNGPLVRLGPVSSSASGDQFNRDKVIIRASGLAYSSLLAAVPLIAVVFAVLSAFGALDDLKVKVQEFLLSNFLPTRQDEIVGTARSVHRQHRQARIPRFCVSDPGGDPAARQRREQLQRHLSRHESPPLDQQDHRLYIGPGPRDAVHRSQPLDLGAGQRHGCTSGFTSI